MGEVSPEGYAAGMKYEEEWRKLCDIDIELNGLKEIAMSGGLRASRFRSVIWRLLLGALTPGFSSLWASEALSSRQHYIELRNSLKVDPQSAANPTQDNPLSQHNESTWHQYFCDQELKHLIHQDVIRTFPGIDFFRDETIQKTMINILFYYARENPAMCYRQGMHEILAPVVFVVHCDQQALLHTQEHCEVRADIVTILDSACLEEDSYTLFRRIMNAIEGSYLSKSAKPSATGAFTPITNPKSARKPENQVITQLRWISERILASADPDLHNHLEKLQISLPLFGIRWLRLLFGREFPLQDLLVLWDAIFAENKSFDLVNYILVAMLITIREKLLSSDYTNCLTQLMRYPSHVDISYVIEYALYLKHPKLYKLPKKMIFVKTPGVNERVDDLIKNDKKILRQQQGRKPKHLFKRDQHGNMINKTHYSHTSSFDDLILDGYPIQERDYLLKELRHTQNIIYLSRIKLLQYHKILDKAIPANDSQAQQALTGIFELSSLLSVNVGYPMTALDPAYEVKEKLPSPKQASSSEPNEKKLFPKLPSSVDMTIFSEISIPFIEDEVDEENRMWQLL